jgi:hypothetical protein
VLALPLDAAQASTVLTRDEVNTIQLFQRNTPSVVFITNLANRWGQLHSVLPPLKSGTDVLL